MKDFFVVANYAESGWGSDIIRFTLPETTIPYSIIEEIGFQKCDLRMSYFETRQDYTDQLFTATAKSLGGTWEYVPVCGDVVIDDEGDKYDNEEEEDDEYA